MRAARFPRFRQRTADHIRPRCWGPPPAATLNFCAACAGCNTLRAALGHCPAVLLLALRLRADFRLTEPLAQVARRLLPRGLATPAQPEERPHA